MKKDKRAQIFTLFAIALIALLFTSYSVYSIVQDRHAIRTRVSTMDNFLFSLEKSLEREVYISGYRTLFLAEQYISKEGKFIPNMTLFFNESFFNGSIFGEPSEILYGVTYDYMVNSVIEKTKKINVEIIISEPEVRFIQEDPWNIVAVFEFNLFMNDESNLASWNKREKIKSRISIEGFEDPIYIINTNSKLLYVINRTEFEGNYVSGSNIDNLNLHLQNKRYAANNDAPSFINRMEGNLNADPNGIESFVDINELILQGLPASQKSIVDHVYFSTLSHSTNHISGMPSWFLLDNDHLNKYNATGVII